MYFLLQPERKKFNRDVQKKGMPKSRERKMDIGGTTQLISE